MMIRGWSGCNAIMFFLDFSQDCMSPLFVMVASFWIAFWEYKTELFWFFSLREGTDVVVNLIADYVFWYEDELTVALSDKFETCDWLYL